MSTTLCRDMVYMVGKVESYLLKLLKDKGALHIVLIDPDKTSPSEASSLAKVAVKCGSAAIMIGGTLGVSERVIDKVVLAVKREVKVPVILFPSNVSSISRYADALWFMSLLNSANTYYIIDAQVQGAYIVKKYGIEPIPLGYIILGDGGVAGFVGQVRPIPSERADIAMMYSLAAQYLGFRFIYLEGGSGAREPLPGALISKVKNAINIPLIVGGGIRTKQDAKTVVSAGADVIVTGTVIERRHDVEKALTEVIEGVYEGVALKRERVVHDQLST
ncbi:MAG: geranylgeranylglyceryl/heptaprenylglyceryl phosphate synthase [Candidatus Nezhaarchaeales archaeon]